MVKIVRTKATDVIVNGLSGLSLGEKQVQCAVYGHEDRLQYPVMLCRNVAGTDDKVYDIPADDVVDVVEKIYGGELPDVMLDLHSGKLFRNGDMRVIRYAGRNLIVTPGYLSFGGMVADMVYADDDGQASMLPPRHSMAGDRVPAPRERAEALVRLAEGKAEDGDYYRPHDADTQRQEPMDAEDVDKTMVDQAEALLLASRELTDSELRDTICTTGMTSSDKGVRTVSITSSELISKVMRLGHRRSMHLVFSAAINAILADDWQGRYSLGMTLSHLPYSVFLEGCPDVSRAMLRRVVTSMVNSRTPSVLTELMAGPTIRPDGRDDMPQTLGAAVAGILDTPKRILREALVMGMEDQARRGNVAVPDTGSDKFESMVDDMLADVMTDSSLKLGLRRVMAAYIVRTGDCERFGMLPEDEEDDQ